MFVLAVMFVPAALADEPITLTILHTNDTHANIQPCTATCNNGNLGGVARRYTAIQQVKAEGGNVLLVDAGDYFQGTLFFNYWQGQEASHFMNALGYQAAAIGNHEFDSGPPALARFIDDADFPVLGANIDASAQVSLTGMIEPYTIITVGGQPIGVFGVTTEDTTFISSPGPDVVFEDVTATAQATVAALQGMGVNKIVALTHIGYEYDQALAAAVSGIDVIVGGHSHTPLGTMPGALGDYPTVVNSPAAEPVLIVSAWEWGKYLGRLDVTFDAMGVVQSYNGAPILIDASIPEDPAIAADVAVFYEPVAQLANTVIGADRTAAGWQPAGRAQPGDQPGQPDLRRHAVEDGRRRQPDLHHQRRRHSRAHPGRRYHRRQRADRAALRQHVATLGLTGADVIAALENGVSRWENTDWPLPPGRRHALQLRPGAPGRRPHPVGRDHERRRHLQPRSIPTEIYIVTTNNFMRTGGDGYTVFRDNAIDPYDSWAVMANSVMEYIELPEADGGLNGVVTAAMYPLAGEGRITKRDGQRQPLAPLQRQPGHLHRRHPAGPELWRRPDHVGGLQRPDAPAGAGALPGLRQRLHLHPLQRPDRRGLPLPVRLRGPRLQQLGPVGDGRVGASGDRHVGRGHSQLDHAVGQPRRRRGPGRQRDTPGQRPHQHLAAPGRHRLGGRHRGRQCAQLRLRGRLGPQQLARKSTPEALLSARFGFATTEFFDASKAGYLRIFFRTYD